MLLTNEYFASVTPDNHLAARKCLERAVVIDPNYAEVWGLLSYMYIDETRLGYNARPEEYDSFQRAIEAARRGEELDSLNQSVLAALAFIHFIRQDMDRFQATAERTLATNPNHSGWVPSWLFLESGSAECISCKRRSPSTQITHLGTICRSLGACI